MELLESPIFATFLSLLQTFTIPAFQTAECQPGEAFQAYETGTATHYGYSWDGRTTASGEILDSADFMAAHKTLPFGTRVCVRNSDNTKAVIVRISDRGPYGEGRIIDLTPAAFESLAPLSRGVLPVSIELLDN